VRLVLNAVAVRHRAAPRNNPPALAPLDLVIGAGEQIAIVGPSGAGKTTLLHLLACALRPHNGSLSLDGRDPWAAPDRERHGLRARLFLAPQEPPLPPRQRVITALLAARLPQWTLAQSLRSLLYPHDIARAHAALVRFDLQDKLWERVDRLSGGERQRVGLARVVLTAACLWLIDEPLSSLDPARAQFAITTLRELALERGATLVCSLHQVQVAQQFPRVLGLREGVMHFDAPGIGISGAQLAALYAQHEEELPGASTVLQ